MVKIMRKIAHKTALYISAVFLIILSGISIYLYNLQISLINGLENQKKFIVESPEYIKSAL